MLDVPYRNLQSHFIHDVQSLWWKEPFISRDRQAIRVANNGEMQCKKKKPKIRIPEGLFTEKFGVTFSSCKEQLLWGDGVSHYTWYQYKSFLCIFVMVILIPHIHMHWIKLDPGDSNFHSNAGLSLSIHQIKGYRQHWTTEHFIPSPTPEKRQFSRGGRTGGPVVESTLQLSKCHQGVKMHWLQERR